MQGWLIPSLVFMAVMCLGGALVSSRAARRKVIQQRLRNFPRASAQTKQGSAGVALLSFLGERLSVGRHSTKLSQELANAGYHSASAPSTYLGAKMLLLLAGLVVLSPLVWPTGMSLSLKLFLVAAGAVTLSFVPNCVVQVRRARRVEEIRSHLPDALDLLEICVSSGMGMDMAWNSVADEVRNVSPSLADEMALTNLEIHLGASRVVAMRHMAERTGGEDLSSLVAILVQSERFGTSISEALRTFSTSMREQRSYRAREAAEKMAVKMLIPLATCIFPALLIVLVGPAAITLYRILTGM